MSPIRLLLQNIELLPPALAEPPAPAAVHPPAVDLPGDRLIQALADKMDSEGLQPQTCFLSSLPASGLFCPSCREMGPCAFHKTPSSDLGKPLSERIPLRIRPVYNEEEESAQASSSTDEIGLPP